MRVLQLGPFPPPHGGVQTNIVAIRDHLRKHGHRAGVVNLTRHRGQQADEVWYPETSTQVAGLLVRLPYDIVHLHLGGRLQSRLVALSHFVTSLPGKKSVLTFHSGGYPSSPEGQGTQRRSLRAFAMRRFDRLIGVNEEIISWFRKCDAAPERVRLILPHAPHVPADRAELRHDLASFSASHAPLLSTVGLLEPEYDLSLQIEAMAEITRVYPEAGLVIIGSGSLEGELRALIDSKPFADSILLAGDVPHEQTLTILSRSRAFLRTTLYDGDSISVREALYLGLPVIATDNGMRPDGCTLVPIRDRSAVESSVLQWLAQEPQRLNSTNGHMSANLDAVLSLYRELVPA